VGRTGIANSVELWTEVLRVLKPGAHLLAFGGTRTYHRMATAIEDAGFEIRDQIGWLYGSGFPKSLDVSKAIDKAAGAADQRGYVATTGGLHGGSGNTVGCFTGRQLSPSPVTEAAKQWDGWGTGLKPAWEPIVLARKPLCTTVASHVQTHGTGALNVGACRVGADRRFSQPSGATGDTAAAMSPVPHPKLQGTIRRRSLAGEHHPRR
jgi:hypothetical protein